MGKLKSTCWKTIYIPIDVPTVKKYPVYKEITYDAKIPVYVKKPYACEKPIYGYIIVDCYEWKSVWVPDPPDPFGSTTIGGDGSQLGHWVKIKVKKKCKKKVVVGKKVETCYKTVLDHYDTVKKTKKVFDHWEYKTVIVKKNIPKKVPYVCYKDKYEWKTWEEVKIEWDKEPIYKTFYKKIPIPRQKVDELVLPAPPNGVIYAEGDIIGVEGPIVSRLTIASEGKIRITGNIQYKDKEGDTAYKNGFEPNKPYEPNPDYDNTAVLGIIARKDVVYAIEVPDKFEINACLMSMTGRVGIEGVKLNEKGEVSSYNLIPDQWGNPYYKKYLKTSIRRLGGITTYRRPVDTVILNGSIVSGFKKGASAFDSSVQIAPPPFFLARPTPRFFATIIEK